MPKEDPFVNRAQLLKAIKKYPEIWDSNNKLHMCRSVTSPMWNEIAEQFGGHVPTVKLQSIWSQMKYHYHNLVHRQILHKERFTTKWEHFEPMSFMYNITVAKIVGAANNGEQQTAATVATSPSQQLQHQQQLSPTLLATATIPQQQHPPLTLPLPIPLPLPQPQGRGRPSGSFTWLPAAPQAVMATTPLLPPPLQHNEISIETTPFTGVFTGLVPPAAITVETTTTPLRKPGRPGSLNNSMRGRIIDVIKSHPVLWAGRQREQRQGQNRTSSVWKEVAAELGLTPSLIQTRWSIIKQRYVDELQKERHSHYTQQIFHSSWEHFERMSFMRDILLKKVDEREQTREHIQEIVSEQQHQLQTQQQQHHQQQQQQQHMRYARNVVTMGGPEPPHDGGVGGIMASHLSVCDDGNNGVGVGVGGDVVGMIPIHSVGRRRVKTENDLEWDPFEMILHVHGTEPAAN